MPASFEHSINIVDGGTCAAVAVSGTSAQSAVIQSDSTLIEGPISLVLSPTVNCFVRKGVNPVAVVNVDTFLFAGTAYRTQIMPGERFAFITESATGNVFIAPGA